LRTEQTILLGASRRACRVVTNGRALEAVEQADEEGDATQRANRPVLRMSDLGLIILLAILASIAFIVVALAIEHYHYRNR
jgi:cell division protein FtsX